MQNSISAKLKLLPKQDKPGTVTIATNMAGRGTDIKLGTGVKEAGWFGDHRNRAP